MPDSETLTATDPDLSFSKGLKRTLADHDLRRLGKGFTELILQRSAHLPEQDQALLKAIYDAGQPIADVARLTGGEPRWLHKRVKRLVEIVLSREFVFVMRHRDQWAPARARAATRLFIYGDSVSRVSRELRLSYYATRRHREAVLALMDVRPAADSVPSAPASSSVTGGAA